MKIFTLALALAFQLPSPSGPTLSEADTAKFQVLELRAENLNLKMALLRAEAERVQAEHSQLMTALKREGFTLARGDDGVYRYTADPANKQE